MTKGLKERGIDGRSGTGVKGRTEREGNTLGRAGRGGGNLDSEGAAGEGVEGRTGRGGNTSGRAGRGGGNFGKEGAAREGVKGMVPV